MRILFRPLPGLTVASGVAFGVLIALGVWQLERLQWKLALIEGVERNLRAAPITLRDALKNSSTAQYRRVKLTGTFANEKEAYVYTTDRLGNPVYHILVPFFTDRGVLLVDRGIVPLELRDPRTRVAGRVAGVTSLVGVWRTPDPPNLFTPAPDTAHHTWYSRDLKSIARVDGVSLLAPVLDEADSRPNLGGWPKGGQTEVSFRNEHLQYALTWFGLAATLIGVYLAYHVTHGRLAFQKVQTAGG